ncbi:MAG: ABC transporter substrate-binding protein, partial [Bacteroidota bacterium]
VATQYINVYTISAFEAKNAEYLEKLQAVPTLSIRGFSSEIIEIAREAAQDTISSYAKTDPFSQKVYEHLIAFKKRAEVWGSITEQVYYTQM